MRRSISVFFLTLFILSCTTLAEKVRLSKFDQTSEAYERTLKRSQYGPAQGFVDPAFRNEKIDFETYKNVKIVDFGVARVNISEDRLKVEQDVALQYFLLDRNILKTINYRQVWRFDETKGDWFLHTPFPSFDH